jgi:MFS family permease
MGLTQEVPDVSYWRQCVQRKLEIFLRPEKQLNKQFWTFFASSFLLDLGLSIYFFLFNLFLIEYHFTERSLGFISGAMTLGTVAGAIPIGISARKWGLRPMFFLCLIAVPILLVFRTLFLETTAQIALAFFAGMALSAWAVCFAPTIAKLTTTVNRAFAFSVIFATGIGTGAVAGLAGGYLPQWIKRSGASGHSAESMRWVLILACAITFLGVWPMMRLRLGSDDQDKRKEKLFTPFLLRFLPAMALWNVATGFFTPFSTVYFSRQMHLPLSRIGVVFSLSQLVQVFAVLLAPLLFARLGTIRGIVCTQIGTAGALYLLSRTTNPQVAIVLFLALTGLQWMCGPGIYSLVMECTPENQRSNASAVQSVVTASSGAAAAAGAGALFEREGYARPLAGGAGVAAMAALLLYFLLDAKKSLPPIDIADATH